MSKELLKITYFKNLGICRVKYPQDYKWTDAELLDMIQRMNQAIDKMSFNKDSHAWKLTCKELKIPHTYKAISEFMKGSAA